MERDLKKSKKGEEEALSSIGDHIWESVTVSIGDEVVAHTENKKFSEGRRYLPDPAIRTVYDIPFAVYPVDNVRATGHINWEKMIRPQYWIVEICSPGCVAMKARKGEIKDPFK